MTVEPYKRSVYYYETDMMTFVHNSNYLRIFEEARIDLMDKIGVNYAQMEEEGITIPQTEAHVRYKQALHYGDTFLVYAKLTAFNGITMTLEYEVRKIEEAACEGSSGESSPEGRVTSGESSPEGRVTPEGAAVGNAAACGGSPAGCGGDIKSQTVLSATGSTTHCFLNKETGRPVALKKHLPLAYERICGAVEK